MGIPSYYKKLSDKIKGLISKSRPSKATTLLFDFNCLIYYCARRSTLPPYPGSDSVSTNQEWEDLLIEDVAKYVQHIWHEAGQPQQVMVSIDGVVPMAKIKQQRLRRFKSIWLKTQEPPETVQWDTNCITPGTDFMRRLAKRLDTLCKKHKGWWLSSDTEPGEGEHKIMAYLRANRTIKGPIIVYGMDADLILLTMLNSPCEAYLMREDSELGVVQTNGIGEEAYSYFCMDVLKQTLWPDKEVVYDDILQYVTAMSLLGNDFLPHSLSIKIRDNGHAFLVNELKEMTQAGYPFVVRNKEDSLWKINYTAVHWLFKRWSLQEEDRLLHTFKRKIQMRGNTQLSAETKPLESPVEFAIVSSQNREWKLKEGWDDVYLQTWLFCKDPQDLDKCCREYLVGLQWVLDYYTGQRQVDMTWFYPRLIPPLWKHMHQYLSDEKPIPEPSLSTQKSIQPEEQLAMVLPIESWHHLPAQSPLRSLPAKYPQFWPTQFGFFTAGRVWTWECEPLLPILPIQVLRQNRNPL